MKYIILDLEWNSAYSVKESRFINEIIEIGAVKLDENLNEIGRYQQLVRSRLNKKLSSRTKNLTHITNEDMLSGVMLEKALADYTEWAGEDTLTMTWSNTDLYVMRVNLKSFLGKSRMDFIERYADLQKFVQEKLGVTGNQISLMSAVELGGFNPEDYQAHRALGDVIACADLFRKYFDMSAIKKYIVDTTTDDYYARMDFKPYYISDLTSPYVDKTKMQFRCDLCGTPMKRVGKWKFANNAFRANFKCSICENEFSGRVRFKKTYDSVIVKSNFVKPEPQKEEKAPEQAEAN